MRWARIAGMLAAIAGVLTQQIAAAAEYRVLPGGVLRTIFPPDGKSAPATVERFAMRSTPVSVGEFQAFVNKRAAWRRDQVPTVFADSNYLAGWPSATTIEPARSRMPVTEVSWFAATAYCESEGARLPTWHEWELAAAADEKRRDARDDPAWRERILGWYSRPSTAPLPAVGKSTPNVFGIHDLHGVVWEWVHDAGSLMVSADNREQGDPDTMRFCGAGALSSNDRENYAILMRVALLSSMSAAGTTRNLGFRCVRPVVGPAPNAKKGQP